MTILTATVEEAPGTAVVAPSRLVVRLGVLICILSGVAAAVGLFWGGGVGPHEVVTVRGQRTQLYGIGLYRWDSLLVGVGNRGTDAVTLFLELPVLLLTLRWHRRGSLRATIVLAGVLGWLLYYYASMCFATAYNRLFPLYVVLFAASLFSAPLAVSTIDPVRFGSLLPNGSLRRVLIGYLIGVTGVLTLAWVPSMIAASVSEALPPRLGSYTTQVTWALDAAVVLPAAAATAWLLYRRSVLGPLYAAALLSLNVALGVALIGQGLAQLVADVPMRGGEVVGAMASFATMTVIASILLGRLLLALPRPNRRRLQRRRRLV